MDGMGRKTIGHEGITPEDMAKGVNQVERPKH